MPPLPDWLDTAKDDILASAEWKELSSDLHAAVRQLLAESHTRLFTDLNDAEKLVMLDRAVSACAPLRPLAPRAFPVLLLRASLRLHSVLHPA